MKLQELALPSPAKQITRVFESYFGKKIKVEQLSERQARYLLGRVRALVNEHRGQAGFHHSEQNPSYLKLMMMEQVLTKKISEQVTQQPTPSMDPNSVARADAAKNQAIRQIKDPKMQGIMKRAAQGQSLTRDEQGMVANAAMAGGAVHEEQVNELSKKTLGSYVKKASRDQVGNGEKLERRVPNQLTKALRRDKGISRAVDRLARESYNPNSLRRKLRESEVQQAQVIMASQDLVDQVQKIIEQMSSIQFKDLPALVDQIKNEVGIDQAMQFNQDATAALGAIVQACQTGKAQLEGAVAVVTGQGPQVPGQTPPPVGGPAGPELGGAEQDVNLDIDDGGDNLDLNVDDEVTPPPTSSLGRKKR